METKYLQLEGAEIAYRDIGSGMPMLLCNRFRGTLDTWDPLFLQSLAKTFRVIYFDYPEIGYSSGTFPLDLMQFSQIVKELYSQLNIQKAIVVGWSFGGFVAQAFALQYPQLTSHLILIGTNPPGENAHPFESVFFERALLPINSEADEVVLFFEPNSRASVEAAKASRVRIYESLDVGKIPATQEKFDLYFKVGNSFREDALNLREKLRETSLPVLIVHGDHDICFPIENWFSFLRQLKNGQLIVFTLAGHGPQHQWPELVASYMSDFVYTC